MTGTQPAGDLDPRASRTASTARATETEPQSFTRAMEALLHPKRIAIVGDSPNRGFAWFIHRNLVDCGYEGTILPVNPRYDEIEGLPTYHSVDAIPGGADLAIVVVPSRYVEPVLEQCERAGVGAVNIITSGFGEQSDDDAHHRQERIREFAQRTGIRVVGPNCLGNISVPNKMSAMSGPFEYLRSGPVGLALQSGLLAYSLVLPAFDRRMGFSYVVTLGNEADIEAADLIRYYAEDEHTRVIGCFIEQFRDADKLLDAAKLAAEREKPIVALKIGRSDAGRRSALAHTGSMVGSDEVADAVMRQYGIIRVDNLDEMTETLAAFQSKTLPRGPGVGAIFVSGGAAGLVSDLGTDLGIELPPLAPQTVERLEKVIPEFGTIGNPLDTTGMGGAIPELMEGALVGMAEDPNIHTVIYGQPYPTEVDLDTEIGQVFETLPERYPDKVFLALSLVRGKVLPARRRDRKDPVNPVGHWGGVPFLQGIENGLHAVASLNRYAAFQRNRRSVNTALDSPAAGHARSIVRIADGLPLLEREAKELLALYGIPVTRERLATSEQEAVESAREIGYPVVMKIESPDILHKSDAGGVLLNIANDEDVRRGFQQIMASAAGYNAAARLSGVLVQEMAPDGRELILGMSRDPDFGPVVAIGMGGVFVEVLKDVALGVPPLTDRDSRMMLSQLRGAAILEGARGQTAADVDAIVDVLSRFSQLCLDLRDDVAEIDINPLLAFDAGQGVKVADCLIIPAT